MNWGIRAIVVFLAILEFPVYNAALRAIIYRNKCTAFEVFGVFLDSSSVKCLRSQELYMSAIGGGGAPPPTPPGRKGNSPLDDWLNPKNNNNNANKYKKRADARLPISFGNSKANNLNEGDETNIDNDGISDDNRSASPLTSSLSTQSGEAVDAQKLLQTNPYMQVVNSLSPSELIGRFTTTAHPRVQAAVKATILGLIGSLPKLAFDTKTITTGERLASLMYQLQMTGYMFKNAEYRLALTSSLGINNEDSTGRKHNEFALSGIEDVDVEDDIYNPEKTNISGQLKVKYAGFPSSLLSGNDSLAGGFSDAPPSSLEVEVDAQAYMSELRAEVKRLRDDLEARREAREEELRKDLLAYIRTLPQQQLKELTSTISPEVLSAMKGLVTLVVEGIGEGKIGPNTITEQSGEAMAQLCMWQLVVGYNLRELEVREEMKSFYLKGKRADIDDGGIIYDDNE